MRQDLPTFEQGQMQLFESGAIVLHIAEHHAGLLPDDFGAHLTLALYHFAYGGDRARARHAVGTALRLRPHDPEALGLRAALEQQQAA